MKHHKSELKPSSRPSTLALPDCQQLQHPQQGWHRKPAIHRKPAPSLTGSLQDIILKEVAPPPESKSPVAPSSPQITAEDKAFICTPFLLPQCMVDAYWKPERRQVFLVRLCVEHGPLLDGKARGGGCRSPLWVSGKAPLRA